MRKSFDFPIKISHENVDQSADTVRFSYCLFFFFFFFFFFKTLMSAKKVPAVAVNCAMTTTEVLRVIVGAGTVYKTIKSLVLVSISIKSNICGVNLSNDVHWSYKLNCVVCKHCFFFFNQMCQLLK